MVVFSDFQKTGVFCQALFIDEFTGSGLVSSAVFENFSPVSSGPGNEIVFVMGNLPDQQALIGGIKLGVEIYILDPQGDAIAEMVSILNGRSGIDAIHIFSHGASGSLSLGSTTLNSNTLLDHQSQLAELGSHLTASGDLLLYGCNVAQGADGQAFIESIARTTGADVAASTDFTGVAAMGGNWVLEAKTGSIEGQNLSIDSFASVLYQDGGAVTIQQGDALGLRSYSLYDYFQGQEFYFAAGPVLIVSPYTGSTGADIVFKCITAPGDNSLTVGNWYTWTELKTTLPASFTNDQTYNNVLIDTLTANEWGTAMDFDIAARINWNNANLPATLEFTLGGSRTYTIGISKAAPPNTAPTAGSGSYTIYEGNSATVTLSKSNTSASDPENDALTFNPTSVSYTASTNAGLKGTYNNVSSSSYSVSDGKLTGNGGVFTWNVTYVDDPSTWGTAPANQTWSSTGNNSFNFGTGASDPEGDTVTYSYVSGKPGWMSVSGTTISGNIAPEYAEQTYTITVNATSSGTPSPIQRSFTITTGTAAQLNDAPTAAANSLALTAVGTRVFTAPNFGFTDLDNTVGLSTATGAALHHITITALPATGTLKLSGTAITLNQQILADNIANLTYTSGTTFDKNDTFSFTVNDGIADSASSYTVTLTDTLGATGQAPVIKLPSVTGSTLLVPYTDASYLNAAKAPATTDYVVTVNGTAVTVSSVGIASNSRTVTLTLAVPVAVTDHITISYTKPASNAVQDSSGNEAASFSTRDVVNGTVTTNSGTGATVITTQSSFDTSIPAPTGNVDVVNTGSGKVIVNALDPNGTIVTTGIGATTVKDPTGSVNTTNTGTGATTVDGAGASSVVTATGTGITNVSNPANNVQVINNSTGSTLITGVSSGNTVIPKGSGEVVVTSVLTTPGTITVDATNKQSNLTADNDSTGTINITGLINGASLKSTGSGNSSGATNIVTPVGNLILDNSGTSPVNITGFDTDKTLTLTGSGSTNVTSPDGNLTVVNNGAGTATVSGALDGKIVTPQGTGPVVVTSVLGAGSSITMAATGNQSNVTADNDGLGVINITGLTEGASLKSTGSGTGATNVVTPIGSLALNNTGTSPVNVTGFDTGKTLTITGGGSTNIVNPDGNVTVNNTGTGIATVSGTTNSSTITTQGTGPITVNSILTTGYGINVNAAANQHIILDNDGAGTITVAGATTGSTIYNIGSGTGTTNISDPTGTGTLTVQNTGADPLTVTGLDSSATLTNTAGSNGSGGIILASPDGNATINNLGSNTVTATGVHPDATISTTGTGTTTITDPSGSLTVNNTGSGTVSVGGLNDGSAITSNGTQPVTISSPDGNLIVHNTGTGVDTVTGLLNNKTVTTDGTGTTTVSDPASNVTLHNTGTGSLTVTGANNGSTVTTTGTTATTVKNPDGNVTVNNTGTGTATVEGTLTAKTVTIGGTGPIVVNSVLLSPGIITVDATLNQQHLTVDNDGTGAINITGLTNGATLKSTGDGTGTTTVVTPIGDLVLESTGTNVVVITGFDTGSKLSVTGTANTTVKNPDGDVTVDNTGQGIVTVEGVPDGKTVTASGPGTTLVNDPLGDITLHNDILTSVVSVSGVNTGKTVTSTGVGPKAVNAPDGDITINSTGTGVTTVSGTLNGSTVTTKGTGPITIHSDLVAGNTVNVNAAANTHITLDNDNTGAINVTGVTTGSTITSTGTGGAGATGTTTIANPTGNLIVDNTGTSPVKITGFDTNKILTVTGNATSSTEVVNPDGNVFVSNNGDGQLTVRGLNNGNSVNNAGAHPVTITNPDGNVYAINDGTGLISVNGVQNGSTVNCTGNGPQTIDLASLTATQSATVDNDGTGTVNVVNIPSGTAVTFTGNGPTTVSSLTGNVTLENLSTSLVTIANAANGSTITTIGDGPFFMDADVPMSQSVTVDITNNANISFDNDGPGVVNVIGSNNNTITTTGNGPMTVTNPLGDLVVANSGSGVVTVNGAANNAAITPQHEGPVVVNSLLASWNSITVDATGNQSHLTVDNDSTGIIKVTNLAEGAVLTSIGSGSGATNVVTPVGNLSLVNTGTSPVNITGFDDGKTLTITGSGSTNITNPDGNLSVLNNGLGTTTVSGALNGKTVTPEGSGPVIVTSILGAGSSITVDAKGNQSHVTADNDGAGVINVTGLIDGATLKSTGSGNGATNVVTPVGNLTLDNTGLSPVNVTGFDNSKTLSVTGSGPTTVSSPDGDMTVANNGSGLVTLTGVLENKTISATGSGNTAISTPNGDIAVANSGSGLVTLTGILDGKIVTTSGTGPATIDDPAGNVTVSNSGTGLVKVNGANDNSTVTTTGDHPVTISSPDGNLTVHNIGYGVDTVTALVSGKTVTTDGSGETIVSDPSGDVTLHNTGTGSLSVTGANNGSTVTTTGSTATTVSNPDGNVTVKNTGTGTTTVDGTHTGSVVTLDGNGPIIVHSDLLTPGYIGVNAALNQNNLTVDNDGTGAINITGLSNGASLKSTGSGTGTTTVSDPAGSISLNNAGANIVTITGFDNDKALTVTGTGPTTVSSPDGNASIINNGSGTVTLTGVKIGQTITASGSGPTNVSDPSGNITLDNSSLTGTISATGVNTGCTVTTTGVGLKEVNAPDGNVTINSTGTGKTTVSGTLSGSTVTTQGTGPITVHSDLTTGTVNVNAAANTHITLDNNNGGAVNVTGVTTGSTIHSIGIGTGSVTINNPVGNLTIDNTGTDPVKITGFDTNKTFTLTGSATSSTEVVDPDGNVVVANSSSAALTISGLNIGNSVTNKAGSGAVNITNPDGNVYAINNGTGAINVSGIKDGSTINSTGSGLETVDLETLGSGHSVTIDNDGSGLVNLLHVSNGTTVSFTGNTLASGSTTISSLSGEVTLENVSVSSSVISVSGIVAGSKIHTTGTGEIAITTALSAGEKIFIDPTGNDHLRITNTGAGQVDLLGSIALDSNDAMAFTLTGTGTTILNETGTLDLGNAPLTLSLAAGYIPQAGDSITLISNDGIDAVTGIFAGKEEGSLVMVGGYQFTISYKGGIDGNDVVLSMSRPPVVDTTDVTGAVAEQGTPAGNITDSGTIGFTDGDLADTHSVSTVTSSSGALGTLTAIRTHDSTGTGLGGVVTWNYSVAASAVEYLAASELKVESFTFSVQDSQGNSVSRTVDVTITGTNDAPTLGSVTNGSIVENALVSTTTDSGLSGTLIGADIDNNHTLTYGITGGTVDAELSTLKLIYGTLSVDTANGTFSYVKDASEVEALHSGENVSDVFTVTITDDHSVQTTQSYTVNLTGANDAPTLAAVTSGSIAEDALASTTTGSGLSGTLVGADVDNDKVLTYGISTGNVTAGVSTLASSYGTLTVNTSTGAYSYAKNAAALESLHVGESVTDVFTVTVTDNHGSQTTQNYTINVTGANDAPTLASVTSGSIAEDSLASTTTSANLSGTLAGADVDNDKVLTYGITGGTVATGSSILKMSYGTLTVNTTTGTYSYAKDAAAVEALHASESVSDVFTVSVTDNHGAQATQSYTINLTGANDAPTLAAVTSGSIAEDSLASTTRSANLSGTLAGADVDNDKVLTYGITGGTVTAGSSTLKMSYGTLTVNTTTGAYSYAKDAAAVEALHASESVSDVFTVSVTDNHGAQATQSYTINLTGANDAPIINSNSSVMSGSITEAGHLDNGQAVLNGMGLDGLTHVTGTLSASDVDNNATQTWSVSDQTPATVYGTMTINSSTGNWDYALNNYLPATQALREGDVVTETFTARVTDDQGAYADQTVTVTINGTNDVPVVANNASALDGVVTEAGNNDNGTVVSGTATASATLIANDVDTGATQVWSLVGKPGSTYGVMSIDPATGKWTYTLDNTLAASQALREGDVDTQTYTARVTDDKDAYVNQTITITINGTNDSPVAVADTNTTSENATLTVNAANGVLANDTDPDTGATHAVNAVNGVSGNVGAAVTGTHGGAFTIAADGSYTFNPGSSFDWLAAGETTTTSVLYTVIDDKVATSSNTVSVTLTGTNDAAIITGTSTASLTETDAVLTTTGTLSVTDVDSPATFIAQTNVAGTNGYGHFSIGTNGVWIYTTDSAHNEFVKDTHYTDSITAATADGTEQMMTVTIAGTNDAPVISGTLIGSITETTGTPAALSTLTSSGTLAFSDIDVADTHTLGAMIASTGALGTMTITNTADTTGTGLGGQLAWSYSVDAATVEYLAAGETKDELFTFTLSDDQGGTTERTVTITLTGTNDAVAIVSGSTIASGVFTETDRSTGSAALDTVSSSIAFTDADLKDLHVVTVTGTSFAWSNGDLTQAQQDALAAAFHLGVKSDSTGIGSGIQAWSFSAPDATFDFLAKNATLTATYTVTFDDEKGSSASRDVVITVTGTNDAAVISGTSTATLTESNAVLTTTGTLSATDVDSATTFVAQTNVAGNHGYGKFSLSTEGTWLYTTNTAHNEFVGSTNYTDSVTVAAADGTQQLITVTIAGTNDAAIITGTSTASLTEGKTALSATGTLSASDVDSTATFVAQTNVAGSNGYGHFSVGTNGVWNYTTDSAHGEFVLGENYVDSITVTTADGTPQLVTVTIAGSNSGAVITGTSTASLTETNAVLTTTGTLVATDLDSPATFVAQTNVAGNHGYGHFTLGTNGVWSYTTDNAHNEFASGTDYTDSFSASTADGTEQVVTVTIAGTNDAAVISGTSTVSLTQNSVPLTTTGTLSATDVDSATTFAAQTDVAGNHGYGTFSIGTDGVWNYTAKSAHGEFLGGADYTDSFTVATADGTQQLVTVTIKGVDDPAVLSSAIATLPASSTESILQGLLTIRDADTPSAAFKPQENVRLADGHGTFTLDATGAWRYEFDDGAGEVSDLFTVYSTDGKSSTTVSVHKTSGPISLGNDSDNVPLVGVQVPVGVGFSEEHFTEGTLATLEQQLVDASKPKIITDGEGTPEEQQTFAEILKGGIQAYVPTVQDQQQVTVRTITFSKDSANTTASTVTISGARGTGESSTENPLRQEALVVDARNLPSGTVLDFNKVEFAIVIGAVQLIGGTGKNFVIGDSASQWIVLGEGDDTLYGGGGDDTIGSHGGNDLIYGDAGNDTLFGGIENDTLSGGSGDDVIYGDESTAGGNGVDTALYTDALAGVKVNLDTIIHDGINPGTADDGILYTTKELVVRTGHDTLYDIENVIGGAYSDIIIGSNADNKLEGGAGDDTLTGGKGNDTVDGGTGKDTAVFSGTMADYSISYDAATHNWTIVDTIAGRDGRDTVTNVERFQFADAFQFQGGSGDETMTGGAGIDTVTYLTALAGITVDLGTGSATSSSGGNSGIGNDTLISIENVIGGDFADTIIGSSADNQLSGGKGNDTLDGASGTDTAVFSGNYADYTIRYDGTTHAYTIADKTADRDGTDTVINIEKFHFADGYGFTGGPGDDTVTGGTGHDTIMYLTALAGITVDLAAGTATTTAGGDTAGIGTDSPLVGIENVVGGDFNDIIIGNSSDNRLEGGKGNDTLLGGGGNDTAVFSGNLADYDVSYNAATDTYTITDKIAGRDDTDTVTNVHNFQFADGTHQDILMPTVGTFSPGSGATGVGVGNDLVLTFSEAIHPGSGTIAIHSGSPTGPVVASSADAASATVTASGRTLTINPTHDLAYNTHYYVTFGDGSIHDLAENSYAGTTTYDFTTGADPYAGGSHGGNSTGVELLGLGALGVLAWAIF